jgi:hypothetical protein
VLTKGAREVQLDDARPKTVVEEMEFNSVKRGGD